MDVFRFIDPKAVRAHLKSLDYRFSTPEAAYLVWLCKTATLDEKIAAWKQIITSMPNCSMERRTGAASIEHFEELCVSRHYFVEPVDDDARRLSEDVVDGIDELLDFQRLLRADPALGRQVWERSNDAWREPMTIEELLEPDWDDDDDDDDRDESDFVAWCEDDDGQRLDFKDMDSLVAYVKQTLG